MAVVNGAELAVHIGHAVEVVGYTAPGVAGYANAAIECMTCGEVLVDFEIDEEKPHGPTQG